jgi:hypothetical protein
MKGKEYVLLATVLLAQTALAAGFDPNTDPSLLGYWSFNEGSGTVAADSSGHGNNGQLMNGPLWVPGKIAGALKFDGVDDYVLVPHNAGLLPTGNEVTVSVWINAERHTGPNNATWQGILSKGDNPRLYSLYTEASGVLHFSTGPSGAFVGTLSTGQVPLKEWVHVVAMVSGGQHVYYINGQPAGTSGAGATLPSGSTSPLNIGRSPEETDREFLGMIDDVRLYNRALTAEEIKKLIPPKLQAFDPRPADGALDVAMPLLQWTPGETALFHNVYVGTTPNLTEADLKSAHSPMPMYYHVAGFTPGATYYWRVDEIKMDMVTIYTGNVWSFTMQALTAYHPGPADKATDVSQSPILMWMPGQGATKHQVFFGDNLDAVTQGAADTDQGTLALLETTFAPGALDGLTTYYWRIDEILTSGANSGPVWSFTTYLSVDDFESYTDDEGSRIYETWVDGWTNGTGSTVGNTTAPFAEQRTVQGGRQSMPMDFNNVNAPFYSEAERQFEATMDWTAGGADTLVLFVRGTPGNKAAPLYVAVEDVSKKNAAVTYPDSAIVGASEWTEWKIPLSSFADVNLAKVKKMTIGVGDKGAPAAGGAGRIYIDDIYVTTPRQ